MKQKQTHGPREQICGCQVGREQGRVEQALGVSRLKLSYMGQMNKGLLCSSGSFIQHPVINHSGKEYGKGCIYMYN